MPEQATSGKISLKTELLRILIFVVVIYVFLQMGLSTSQKSSAEKNSSEANASTQVSAYTNQNFRYQLEYPQDWSFRELYAGRRTDFFAKGANIPALSQGTYIGPANPEITLTIQENPKNLSLQEFYAIQTQTGTLTDSKEINLNGAKALSFTIADGKSSRIVAIQKGAQIFEIKDFAGKHQKDGIFDRISSSFKFMP